jgi:hypothetical protein
MFILLNSNKIVGAMGKKTEDYFYLEKADISISPY